MSFLISKKNLEYLANLARIKLDQREEEKLLRDLQKILDHFKELQGLDTSSVTPLAGGAELKNIFREDGDRESTNRGAGVDQLPKKHGGYLKIPPVFG